MMTVRQRLDLLDCSRNVPPVWRRSDSILVGLALRVLRREASRATGEPLATLEVRLVLRAIALFVPRRDALEAYWRAAVANSSQPWQTASAVECALEQAGWRLPPEHEPGEGWAMCNRFRMTAKQAELAARYGVSPPYLPDESYPSPELFPKRVAWIVRKRFVHGQERTFDALSWG